MGTDAELDDWGDDFPPMTKAEVASRLVDLVYLLSRRNSLTLQQIRHAFASTGDYAGNDEAARKKLQRDRNQLGKLGIEVDFDPADNAYSMRRDPHGPTRRLTPEETAATALACRRVLPTVAADVRQTLLSGLVKLGAIDLLEDDVTDSRSVTPAVLVPVADACRRRRPLRIRYTNSAGEESERVVHPWAMSLTEGHWYVRAWDERSATPRTFKVSRIGPDPTFPGIEYREPEDGVDAAADLTESPYEWGDAPPHAVQLTLLSEGASHLLPRGAALEADEDGSWIATVAVRDDDAFATTIFGLGTMVEVVSPRETRSVVQARLDAAIADLAAEVPVVAKIDAAAPPQMAQCARDRNVVRTERLLRLIGVALAKDRHPWDRKELCTLLQVDEEELAHDLGLLMYHCGMPPFRGGDMVDVYADEGTVTVAPEVDLPLMRQLTNWEIAAIGVALRTACAVELDSASADLLRSALDALGLMDDPVDVAPPNKQAENLGALSGQIAQAVHDMRRCRIEYYKPSTDEARWRNVDPLHLFVDKNRTYLAVWDIDAGGRRNFRLDRIRAVEVCDEEITHAPGIELAEDVSPFRSSTDRRVVVEIPQSHVDWARGRYGPDAVVAVDGRTFLLLWTGNFDRLAPTLLSLTPACRVVDPPEARSAVVDLALTLRERYA